MSAFDFSLIIAAFDVESYLDETLSSIAAQDYPRERVEVIVVDDGSRDQTARLVHRWQQEGQLNLQFFQQSHRGASAARNLGLRHARGTWVNFLDADDKLSEQTLTDVAYFFQDHPEICLTAIPIRFFDRESGEHALNDKFRRSRVIELAREPDKIITTTHNSFFRRETLIQAGITFDDNLRYCEDTKFLAEFFARTSPRYGVLTSSTYWYRRRQVGGSLVDNNQHDAAWYLPTLERADEAIRRLYQTKKDPQTWRFLAVMVAYDLNWRYRADASTGDADYKRLLRELTVWCPPEAWSAILSQPLIANKSVFPHLNRLIWQIKFPDGGPKRLFWQMYTWLKFDLQRLKRKLSR